MSLNINDFVSTVHELMDSGRYDEAKRIVLARFKEVKTDKERNILLLVEIAGFLIDNRSTDFAVGGSAGARPSQVTT